MSENSNILSFSVSQAESVEKLLKTLSPYQINWLSGYLAGIAAHAVPSANVVESEVPQRTTQPSGSDNSQLQPLTILYGSKTGNGLGVARKAYKKAIESGFSAVLKDMADYKPRDLKAEENLMLIVSTHGNGEPPFPALELYDFVHSKRATGINNIKYTVLSLGDRNYESFCKTGKDFDSRLASLGAKSIFPRTDCDVEFAEDADKWITHSLNEFSKLNSAANDQKAAVVTGTKPTSIWTKTNPFSSSLLNTTKLSGRNSSKKVYHLEFDLAGSGLSYDPGDAAGILPYNSIELIENVLDAAKIDPESMILHGDHKIPIYEGLYKHFEVSAITPDVVLRYANQTNNTKLQALCADNAKLREYLKGRDVLDLVNEFPFTGNASDLAGVLRKLQPRMYSIASAIEEHPDELHLTVGLVEFQKDRRILKGAGSSYLSLTAQPDEKINLFIEHNQNFKLPVDSNVPIIMVGPGTGVAPFRSFVEKRAATGAKGKNWLFFGDRTFTQDFLYQVEWQKFLKDGVLHKLDLAFSRDTKDKVYVQHKLAERSKEIYKWLMNGAHFYVCGDMHHMARDVQQTLLSIIEKEGKMDADDATAFLRELQKQKRYQTDVY